jgi:hypothetical protein
VAIGAIPGSHIGAWESQKRTAKENHNTLRGRVSVDAEGGSAT